MSHAWVLTQTRAATAYVELLKPRIVALVLVTCAIGFVVGGEGVYDAAALMWALLGTGMVAGGAAALNHYLERDVDKRMLRTQSRPLPSGVIQPVAALMLGAYAVLGGCLVLVWQVNLLTAFLGLLSAFLYVLVYTPLKRHTWLNTPIGAIPGAIPPMMGWTAATGEIGAGAWVLFGILFLWQHPHFYSIAWIFREDYRRGGFQMLPVIDGTGTRTFIVVLATSMLLFPVVALPYTLGLLGPLYLAGALGLTVLMFRASWRFCRRATDGAARELLRASVLYLPCLLAAIVIDLVLRG
jgi:protoheme IX farnesyltransferase